MFTSDYKNLTLSFNEFHEIDAKNMPEYGEFCLLELKDGRHTAGKWYPNDYKKNEKVSGSFGRGLADSVPVDEVSKWHSLSRYDLSECLTDEEIDWINLGPEKEDSFNIQIQGFHSFKDGDFPKSEQYCLLIMMDGNLAAGRWDRDSDTEGSFIYASALASYDMDEVWAWTPLSNDAFFDMEVERENEIKHEEELNRNPSTDPVKFKYGTDIDVYYEKALEKLRKNYPWASLNQMKKVSPWEVLPLHGKYVFGRDQGTYFGSRQVDEWEDGTTADEFIDFLCKYTREAVERSNPEKKFRLGPDIAVYLDQAYKKVKKEYRWLNKRMLKKGQQYAIQTINGESEFTVKYPGSDGYSVMDCGSAEEFIERVESDYQNLALRENPVVDSYDVPFGKVEIYGWFLEKYTVCKLKSGDYRVDVQAGNRTTGGNRTFFITPDCFKADTYEEFLDRYQEVVPGCSFGITKEDMLSNEELKRFFGYAKD